MLMMMLVMIIKEMYVEVDDYDYIRVFSSNIYIC